MSVSEQQDGARNGTTKGYRQRTRAACTNCRRKKVRCTGERPICALCSRTSQEEDCLYDMSEDPEATSTNGNAPPTNDNMPRPYSHYYTTWAKGCLVLRKRCQGIMIHSKRRDSLVESSRNRSPDNRPRKRARVRSRNRPSTYSSSPALSGVELAQDYGSILPLPTHRLLTEAVNVYMQYSHNQPYAIFNPTRLRQHPERLPLYLQFALIATAVRFADLWASDTDVIEQNPQNISRYASAAWRNVSMPWSSHDDSLIFPIIQAIHLLSVIDYVHGRCSASWVKLGMAIRLAYLLRMHLEVEEAGSVHFDPVHQEERRRVFWSIFILDRLISCSRDRYPAILEDDCTVFVPCPDSEFESGSFSSSRSTLADLTHESTAPSLGDDSFALVVQMSAALGRVCRYVLHEQNVGHQPVPWSSESQHMKLDSALLGLEARLTADQVAEWPRNETSAASSNPSASGRRLLSQNIFHLCYCLLYHPFLLQRRLVTLRKAAPPTFIDRLLSICQSHATAITTHNSILRSSGVVMPSFYSYCQGVAFSIHAVANSPATPALTYRQNLNTHCNDSLANLSWMSNHWPIAKTILSKVEKVSMRLDALALGTFSVNTSSKDHIQDEELVRGLWEVVDYGANCTATTGGSTSVAGSYLEPFDSTGDFDPMLLEILAQQVDWDGVTGS
ncbi:hypothetical protein E4T38_09606 [Aureobasidium subglaciale]|nr:hypothetical protein E4T38_09606 [Aureobasidium subglaciale]KAI5213675.1 hypothetical protein E4T40_09548 [Aureobasidium subglaciale]KAI5215460.1 hypothetical protein E4T41_09586 [Aureobasidium subglaciale]KAI5253351.1 hypothetical protein E4T46_09540 [Aureobasidium subglaciale]